MKDLGPAYKNSLIKKIRKSKGMTLEVLSKKTGLSLSFISQVERGVTNPSINSLRKIAVALEVPLTTFFEESHPVAGPVVRKHERKVLENTDSHLTYQLLSLGPSRRLDFLLTRLEVGATSAEAPMAHKGDEAALVLQGKCRIELGYETYELEEGDSLYIKENTPHKFTNIGNVPLIIISAIAPPGF